MSDRRTFGTAVRAARRDLGLSQADLARRTGILRPLVSRLEVDRHTPSLETCVRVAAALDRELVFEVAGAEVRVGPTKAVEQADGGPA